MKLQLIWEQNSVYKIVFIYTFLGLLWIPVADQLLQLSTLDSTLLGWLQTLKDLGFILLSSGLLYILTHRSSRSLQQVEEALGAKELLLRTVVTNAPIILYALDSEGVFTFSDGKGLDALGVRAGQVVGQSVFDLYSYNSSVLENIRRVLSGKEQTWTAELDNVVYENYTTPLRDQQRNVIGLIGVATDITQRQRAEASLRQANEELENRVQERTEILMKLNQLLICEMGERQLVQQKLQRYQLLAEQARDIVLFIRPDGQILEANCAAEQAYGYQRQELLSLNIEDLRDAQTLAVLPEQITQVKPDGALFTTTHRRKDGTTFPVEVSSQSTQMGHETIFLSIVRDITNRQQAKEALQRSEARFQKLTANVPGMIYQFLLRPDGTYTFPFVSSSCQQIYELEAEQIQQNAALIIDIIHPQDRQSFQESVALSARTLEPWQWEGRIITPSGKLKWVQVASRPEKQTNTEILWDGLLMDITERKQAEEALRQSESQLRFALDAAQMGTWDWEIATGKEIWSERTESMFGFAPGTFPGTYEAYCQCIHPDDQDALTQARTRSVKEGLPYDVDYRILRLDGTTRWITVKGSVVYTQTDQPIRMTGVVMDITERKRSEEDVRFLQAMKQAVFESEDFHTALKVALQKVCEATSWDFGEAWVPSADGKVLECSPAWYSCVESLDEFRQATQGITFAPGVGLPGRVWASRQPEWRRDVSTESDQIYQRAQLAMECGLKAALGIPLIANNGVVAVLVFYMFESRDQDQRLIELISASTELGLFIQRKQAEEEIRNSLEKEKELSELKSRFISMTSHEFRTPLATILFSAGVLDTYGSKLNEEKKQQHLHRIKGSVQRMTQLLEDVLLIGKAEAGKLDFKPVPLELNQFCSELVEEIQQNDGSNHTINFIKDGICTLACMDEKLLRHILSNLLSNAIKYSPQGTPINFEATCHNGEVTFKIQDQGIGIPLEELQHLFETFHRAKNVGTISGTGLGLAIVKKSVELQGGQIAVESQVGVGSTFIVTLPLNQQTSSLSAEYNLSARCAS